MTGDTAIAVLSRPASQGPMTHTGPRGARRRRTRGQGPAWGRGHTSGQGTLSPGKGSTGHRPDCTPRPAQSLTWSRPHPEHSPHTLPLTLSCSQSHTLRPHSGRPPGWRPSSSTSEAEACPQLSRRAAHSTCLPTPARWSAALAFLLRRGLPASALPLLVLPPLQPG